MDDKEKMITEVEKFNKAAISIQKVFDIIAEVMRPIFDTIVEFMSLIDLDKIDKENFDFDIPVYKERCEIPTWMDISYPLASYIPGCKYVTINKKAVIRFWEFRPDYKPGVTRWNWRGNFLLGTMTVPEFLIPAEVYKWNSIYEVPRYAVHE